MGSFNDFYVNYGQINKKRKRDICERYKHKHKEFGCNKLTYTLELANVSIIQVYNPDLVSVLLISTAWPTSNRKLRSGSGGLHTFSM